MTAALLLAISAVIDHRPTPRYEKKRAGDYKGYEEAILSAILP